MSNSSHADSSQLSVDNVRLSFVYNYCGVASLTLLVYHHILTISEEVTLIWGRRLTGATVLFILNRYVSLINQTLSVVVLFPWSNQTNQSERCIATVVVEYVFVFILYCVVALFAALRIFAIWNRDWKLFLMVLSLGLVWPCYTLLQSTDVPECLGRPNHLSLSARGLSIAAELLVIILTWWRTYGIMKVMREAHLTPCLSMLLLRDGTAYFGSVVDVIYGPAMLMACRILSVILILSIADLIIFTSDHAFDPVLLFINACVFAISSVRDVPKTSVPSFTPILVSRFMLDLREVYVSGHTDESTESRQGTINFASNMLGNMGAPLDPCDSGQALYNMDAEREPPVVSSDPLMVGLIKPDPVTMSPLRSHNDGDYASSGRQSVIPDEIDR
ncbi:hypothetical protein B0H21DRAFT_711987 [Amylocystis lapponica]|nr:hypothetical protein B0H21DRAFT_711987 [Amylocystis lapponica]